MCGIAGCLSLERSPVPDLKRRLDRMSELLTHRGPDGNGVWENPQGSVGLAHRRLSIIELSAAGAQPMVSPSGATITYNGEIYNFASLRRDMESSWHFRGGSDTEVILALYDTVGHGLVDKLRGMFSFAIWDDKRNSLFCARDRFGIKPFYFTTANNVFYFASEMKALLPFLDDIVTDSESLEQYLAFQYTLGPRTLFSGIHELPPGHTLLVKDGRITISKYWDVNYDIDFDHSEKWFVDQLDTVLNRSVEENLVSDVEVGVYVSGGIDSSLVYRLANSLDNNVQQGFHGRFTDYPGFDESSYALDAVSGSDGTLHIANITAQDFINNVEKVIYHLDTPTAGPGSFPQFMVSQLASQHVKTVLGGQGGDEIFGGYARYVIAYLEQCLSAAIDGTYTDGNFVVTLKSLIPNMGLLREYKPMIRSFWSKNLFGPLGQRYFDLLEKTGDLSTVINPDVIDSERLFGQFEPRFHSTENVRKEAYLDSMMHFDFKNLLPALLQVEDRMSMAHGLESRVPFLDHDLVSLVASVPADIKFSGGATKRLLKHTFANKLPESIVSRRDKMGFPVPLAEWSRKAAKEFISDTLLSSRAQARPYLKKGALQNILADESQFSRRHWVLLSLELWHQQFHDRASSWRFS